jgi:hypothetical protein
MLETQQNPPKEIPSYLKVFGVLLVIVLAYLGWVFYGRWTSNQQYRDKAAQQKADQAARDRYAVDKMGGDRFEILQFYAYPPSIHFGDDTSLCYGVSNAKSVTLQPQNNEVWPAFSKCVTVAPRKTTTYTLTATDADGQSKTSTVTVEVR